MITHEIMFSEFNSQQLKYDTEKVFTDPFMNKTPKTSSKARIEVYTHG